MWSAERNPGPGVLDRAFVILDALRDESAPLGLAQLSRRTQLPKATTFRLANQLIELHVLVRRDGGYILGSKLFELGTGTRNQALRQSVMTYLDDLHEAVHEIVHLGVLEEEQVLYVERVSGRRTPSVETAPGTRQPLYCTALGKAILAHGPRSLVERVVANGLNRRTPFTIIAPGMLMKDLQRVRATGVAYDREEYQLGITCVASPLLDKDGRGRGAISVTGPAMRLNPERVAVAVRAAALGASRCWIEKCGGDPTADTPWHRSAPLFNR